MGASSYANERRTHDVDSQGLYSNPVQFYDFLQNRVLILFKPKFEPKPEDGNIEHPDFELVLSKKMNYDIVSCGHETTACANVSDQMSTKVGDYLKHDPIKLRFTTTQANGQPKHVIKRSLNQSISEIMTPAYVTPSSTVILYELLDVSIVELETKRSLKIVWTGIQNKEEATHSFLLPKTSPVSDLSDHLRKQVSLSPGGTGKIRVFEVSKDGKTQKEYTNSEMIGNIPDPADLYAEVCHDLGFICGVPSR